MIANKISRVTGILCQLKCIPKRSITNLVQNINCIIYTLWPTSMGYGLQ